MGKRVFIVHRWDGSPNADWYAWLKRSLQSRGFQAMVPEMPNPDQPRIMDWVNRLRELVRTPDKETYFVGHSVGCQTILRYLQTADKPVGGALFVAPWLSLKNLESAEEKQIAKPWLENPVDFGRVKQNCPKMCAIFSDDDPCVPLEENVSQFKQMLNAKIVVEKLMGHFTQDDDVVELPIALKEFQALAK